MRVHNFNAGPAALPLPVLEIIAQNLTDLPFKNGSIGMSVMEMSHRSPQFQAIRDSAELKLRRLMNLGDDWAVLFLQGGATLQFSMAPLNLLVDEARADYLLHGTWGVKALKEAQKVSTGTARIAASTKESGWKRVPRSEEIRFDENAKYVHITTNETIEGVQWPTLPDTHGVPFVADMSSDILSKPFEEKRFGLFYAGAQKNIGPSGVTVVGIRRDWIQARPELPIMLDYSIHEREKSLYNTPATFGIYAIDLVCDWIESNGGLQGMQNRNARKAKILYDIIDESDFYSGFADTNSRSQMNVTWRLPDETLENRFVDESENAGMIGLKGHRSVGGLRASIYNAVEPSSVESLGEFMREFEKKNG